ncbi:transposase [Streptomyces sp. NPDC057654]|uniref:transposase n=1 Tax=Streptomyces sp. NPDC057654 TaxID=3346196 RepID=UPI0036C302FA
MSLTDAQWARIEQSLPDRTPRRGGRWEDHREVIDAIAFKFHAGTRLVHLPEKYGNWRGVCNRLWMWAVDGTWKRVFTAPVARGRGRRGRGPGLGRVGGLRDRLRRRGIRAPPATRRPTPAAHAWVHDGPA